MPLMGCNIWGGLRLLSENNMSMSRAAKTAQLHHESLDPHILFYLIILGMKEPNGASLLLQNKDNQT